MTGQAAVLSSERFFGFNCASQSPDSSEPAVSPLPIFHLPGFSSNPYGYLDYRFTTLSPMSYSGNSKAERVSRENDAVNSEHLYRKIKGQRFVWPLYNLNMFHKFTLSVPTIPIEQSCLLHLIHLLICFKNRKFILSYYGIVYI